MPKDPTQVAAKWSRNFAGATQAITDGVNRVTVAPQQQAAAAVDVWQQRVSSARARDKFVNSLQRGTLAQWQQAMLTKGIPRLQTGATSGQPKVQSFMQQWLPYVYNVASQVNQMPHVTLEDGVARASAQIRGNAAFRRT